MVRLSVVVVGPTTTENLTGVVERIIFLNEENHYTIAEFRPDQPARAAGRERAELVTIVGPLPGVECGETLHLTGEWTRHAQHGAQFKVLGFKSELPASVFGIRKYLGSGLVPGIGKVYANKIVDAFGTDTFRVLSEESAQLRTVPGIGRKRAAAIKAAWDAKRTERELYIFLQTYGVTPAQCVKIVRQFGPAAKNILIGEPYRVAREIDGIGFKTADRIAINLGFANDAPPRLDAGIIYALETLQEEGHTAFREIDLIDYASRLLESDSKLIAARIDALVGARQLVRHPAAGTAAEAASSSDPARGAGVAAPRNRGSAPTSVSAHPPSARMSGAGRPDPQAGSSPAPLPGQASTLESVLQLPHNDRAERKIADVVDRLNRVASGLPPIKVDAAVAWAEQRAGGITFQELQRAALRHALSHKLTVLTGGPGTGKTTILRALVEILKAKKVRVHLAAPTGRAAQRLAESTGGFASTIHRLLKYDPAAGGFVVNESAPLGTDFLIVDEASMLDARLASALLQAVPARAHLLLVGDTDQLPSVGAGNVLQDLIASGRAPVTRLSIIFRQTHHSSIVTTAHAINAGDPSLPPAVAEIAEVPPAADLTFIAATDAEDCLRKVLQLCTEFIPRKLPGAHPINDVQVLAPMHKGTAGVANLNVQLQAALNPGGRGLRTLAAEYRTGDKVIQLRNNYDKNLFNGDIGAVAAVNPEAGTMEAVFDGERHTFGRAEFGDLALAYAISIHKSQGSEYPIVVIPLLKAHFLMLQRNLVYTAVTRGRRKVFLVGEPAAYAMAVRNSESRQRVTHLREKLLPAAHRQIADAKPGR